MIECSALLKFLSLSLHAPLSQVFVFVFACAFVFVFVFVFAWFIFKAVEHGIQMLSFLLLLLFKGKKKKDIVNVQ